MKKTKRTEPKKSSNDNDSRHTVDRSFCTDILSGLGEDEVFTNRKKFGRNRLTKTKRKSFFSKFVSNLKDPIIKILIGALILNTALMFRNINWPETIGILCAVLTAALVSTVSEHGSERAFDRLCDASGKGKATVLRGGMYKDVDTEELTVGDIIVIGAGMKIPADCYIIRGKISVSEAALTGESAAIKKHGEHRSKLFNNNDIRANESKLYMGCLCTKGECEAVVTMTGDDTEYGKIAKALLKDDRNSPLKERLLELAKSVSKLGYAAAAMIMAAYLINTFLFDSSWNAAEILSKIKDVRFVLSSVISAVTLGVSVIVVAVPEGLPMMITVVLSSNMKKMLRSGVLVRKMVGIETSGSMNILFTDKTGTLTTGNMTVNSIYTDGLEFKAGTELSKHPYYKSLIPILSYQLIRKANKSPTEKALTDFFKSPLQSSDLRTISKLEFNSENKYSACLYETGGTKSCAILGAPEKLLAMSDRYTDPEGRVRKMDAKTYQKFYDIIQKETKTRSRVLSVCFSDCERWCEIENGTPSELIFSALISIKDELRKDALSSIVKAKEAGVQVVMVTGDNMETAKAVAKECGITDEIHYLALYGDEISSMNDEDLKRVLPSLAVVARATPTDKQRLVQISAKSNLTSGMTGDGVNDAPSLKCADVGFAMGSGSDVAKEAADIVITNDSISSITNAILYGRCVFESIRKFITFQLTMNLCALGVSLIGPFIGVDSPITVIQMLWVNIIMDTLGGLAFAGEIPLSDYMKRPPLDRSEKILSVGMIKQILFLGTYTLSLCIAFIKVPLTKKLFERDDDLYFLTCFFALFIFCGIFNSFNSRAPSGHLLSHISGNKAFIFIIMFVAAVQLTIIYLGGTVFRCAPLKIKDLLITAAISFTVIPADAIRKRILK